MIYVLGDSFSFGWNFFMDSRKDREQLVFGHLLSKKLNMPYKNLSMPAGSNWRIARLVSMLDLTKDDVVVISWTAPDRYEVPSQPLNFSPLDKVFDINNHKVEDFKLSMPGEFFQFIERFNNQYTRRVYRGLIDAKYKTNNNIFKNLYNTMYENFYCPKYYDQMFKVMYSSTLCYLQHSQCKFIMFNGWTNNCQKVTDIFNIKEYLFGSNHNMTSVIRNKKPTNPPEYYTPLLEYWTEKEHEQVAEIIYKKLKELYDI